MIRRFTPLLRRSLSFKPSAGFCLYKGYLDPHKHNTMNHNIHNVYIELYDTGVYPQWVVNQSEAARTYQSQTYSLAVQVLKKVHPQITVEYLQNNNHRTWNDALRRLHAGRKLPNENSAFQNSIHNVINKLAFNIIVKESKWTWVKQQQERLKFTNSFFQQTQIESIDEFFKAYNLCIESLINISNFGLAKDILHDHSSLEKAILNEQNNEDPVGVQELEGNTNPVNRFLSFIHKI